MTDVLRVTGDPALVAAERSGRLTTGEGAATDQTAPQRVRQRIVLDTSVLIADPDCLTAFDDADIVLPLTVIEELDGLKNRLDDVGRSARTALRAIEELRVRHGGSLATAVQVGTSSLRIEINSVQKHRLVEHGLDPASPDNRIIGAALGQAELAPTTMVSNDAALRIKAAHLGVDAAEHSRTTRHPDRKSVGWATLETGFDVIDCLYAAGAIDADAVDGGSMIGENEFAVLRAGSQSALTRRVGDEFELLSHTAPEAWGLRARSKEQRFALELLLDPAIEVVALDGRAGTGKTLLAIAAGFEQVVEHNRYERLAVYRPLVPVGRADVGYLPGGLEEKLDPWMSAIHDAVVALTDHTSSADARRLIEELTTRGQLSLESVTFLRGRSLQRQIVVIDEAQNLEPTTLRTILTRVGQGTKVIFTGDTSQIDAPYLGESNNALAVLAQAFRGQQCFGHITLTACERSDVASLAAELL
ncbi:PhoH family protein [Desertimonas flava]|uniref:PhoH family protein n=1 Tax=Desertimonas flava TaxID=2064846 RepID=UPI0013C48B6B|nr:PhoH family protein [Desertimonas flava]